MTYRGSSEISPKGLAVIREHALHFVKHLMSVVSTGILQKKQQPKQHHLNNIKNNILFPAFRLDMTVMMLLKFWYNIWP